MLWRQEEGYPCSDKENKVSSELSMSQKDAYIEDSRFIFRATQHFKSPQLPFTGRRDEH